MTLIIMICLMHTPFCSDRIVRQVDNCIMSGMLAQAIVARSSLISGRWRAHSRCGR